MAVIVKDTKTEAQEVNLWQSRVKLARRYMDSHGDTDGRWMKNVKAMAGDFNSRAELGEEAIDVNMVHSTHRTVLPPLWITEPHLTIRPTVDEFQGRDNVRQAEVTEVELNYWFGELEVRKQIRKCVSDMEATNHGYLYIGYTEKKEDIEIDGERHEPDPLIRHRQPFIRRVSPRRVLVPPGYDELEHCPWVDIVWLKPLSYVKARYGERAKDVVPTRRLDESSMEDPQLRAYADSDEAALVELHNGWDKTTGKVYIFTEGIEQFLEEPADWPWEAEGFPLAHESAWEIPDEYWGTPPVSYYLPQNKELNATRTAMRKNRNRTKSVVWTSDEIAREKKEAYAKAQDGEMIGLPLEQGEDVRHKLMADPGPSLNVGDLQYEAVIKGDMLNLTGIGAEQRGSGDPNIDSATASANVEKHSQVRSSDRGDRVRSLYLQAGRKLWMILKSFPNEQRTRRIAGNQAGVFRSLTYTLDELRGEFQFDMDLSAMLADNPATRAQQAILNYNLMRADPLVNPQTLLLDTFRSQGKVNPESYLVFLRQPDQEMQMMMQNLPVEAHDRDDHEQHIQAHDEQGEMLDRQLSGMDRSGGAGMRLAIAQALLHAHIQDHVVKLQRLQGVSQRPAGQPVAENLLRSQTQVQQGRETQAEMTGQTLQ